MANYDHLLSRIDDGLIARIAPLSASGQRWLKTALHSIRTTDVDDNGAAADTIPSPFEASAPHRPETSHDEPLGEPLPNLEDVITGKADLREQLDSYPDLGEELEGLADIIDMLREAGERRRKRGEQILREEILGQPPEDAQQDDEPLL